MEVVAVRASAGLQQGAAPGEATAVLGAAPGEVVVLGARVVLAEVAPEVAVPEERGTGSYLNYPHHNMTEMWREKASKSVSFASVVWVDDLPSSHSQLQLS